MKIKLTTLLVLFSLPLFSQYFVNPDSRWNVEVYSFSITSPNFSRITYEYKFDTPIDTNNHTYYLLYTRQEEIQPEWAPPFFAEYYRETDGIVYRTHDFIEESISYDFNIDSVSQIIHIGNSFSGLEPIVITQIDSITIEDGSKRRRIIGIYQNFPGDHSIEWIEGIGATQYPWDPTPLLDGPQLNLQCFYQNDSLLFVNNENMICYSFIVNNEEVAFQNSLNIYPNPFQNELHLDFELDLSEGLHFQLYNAIGQLVFTQELLGKENQINLSDYKLGAGLYSYELRDEQQRKLQQGKLIRQ